jgi:hypothetical protein
MGSENTGRFFLFRRYIGPHQVNRARVWERASPAPAWRPLQCLHRRWVPGHAEAWGFPESHWAQGPCCRTGSKQVLQKQGPHRGRQSSGFSCGSASEGQHQASRSSGRCGPIIPSQLWDLFLHVFFSSHTGYPSPKGASCGAICARGRVKCCSTSILQPY